MRLPRSLRGKPPDMYSNYSIFYIIESLRRPLVSPVIRCRRVVLSRRELCMMYVSYTQVCTYFNDYIL